GARTVPAVARFNGRTYCLVSGVGLVRPEHTGKFVTSGTINFGRFEWGTFEPKTLLETEIVTEPLPAGTSVLVSAEDDIETVGLGIAAVAGSTGLGSPFAAHDAVLSTAFAPVLTLNASA